MTSDMTSMATVNPTSELEEVEKVKRYSLSLTISYTEEELKEAMEAAGVELEKEGLSEADTEDGIRRFMEEDIEALSGMDAEFKVEEVED